MSLSPPFSLSARALSESEEIAEYARFGLDDVGAVVPVVVAGTIVGASGSDGTGEWFAVYVNGTLVRTFTADMAGYAGAFRYAAERAVAEMFEFAGETESGTGAASDTRILDGIAYHLNAEPWWDASTVEIVAESVRLTGRPVDADRSEECGHGILSHVPDGYRCDSCGTSFVLPAVR